MRYLEESGSLEMPFPTTTDIVALLCARAQRKPAATAYLFLADGETESGHLSYADLDLKARAIAARLQAAVAPGERALLLYPPGLDYVAAFFGCLYAGVVAVPAYPPSRRQLARLSSIVEDAAPAAILGTAELVAQCQDGLVPAAPDRIWLATDDLDPAWAGRWTPPVLTPDSLAFLQYTSGSTGQPKGVMVSHGNLIANQEAIRQGFGHTEASTVVGWLPLYHDMGLIGNILQPLYVGSTAVLMPPLAFLEQPVRWLRAISTYRAATSGGPDFAYALCARKVTEAQKHGLDLGCWTLAFNGAEPVRAATLERFAAAFAGNGFRRDSIFPCYGLAEATLFVSGDRLGRAAGDPVSCGQPWTGHAIRIVDPETRLACAEGQTGEVWVAGPSVAQGYWNRPELSEWTFKAGLEETRPDATSPNTFLRTGDLGCLQAGRLYINGRLKDLIIVRGRNFHPQDIEHALTDRIEVLRPGGCAAFPVTVDGVEQAVVVAEISREAVRGADFEAVFTAMRTVLAEECELSAVGLALVRPGAVPKTSSGKLRRRDCKQAYLDGSLPLLARSGDTANPLEATRTPEEARPVQAENDNTWLLREALSALPAAGRAPLIARFLRAQAARLLRTSEAGLTGEVSLRGLGFDSLKAVELKHAVDDLLGGATPLTLFLSDATLADIAGQLAAQPAGVESQASPDASDPRLLSPTQRSIWAIQQRYPDSPVYNLQAALRLRGGLDAPAFERALRVLLARHEVLRTVYRAEGEDIIQTVLAPESLRDDFALIDATAWEEDELRRDMERRAADPFDLAAGPIARTTLYRLGVDHHALLFSVHHIAVDLWAVLLLLEELRAHYEALRAGRAIDSALPRVGYRDFASWQRHYPESAAGQAEWDYWRIQLADDLPILELPTDFPRPTLPSYRGGSCTLRIDTELADRLRALAQRRGATVFTLLLAAYSAWLHRYTRQDDLIVGTAGTGRSEARFAPVVGNCVNPLAIRARLSSGESFTAHLDRVKATVLDALAHQDLPFSSLVKRLRPTRSGNHWPIFQTLFVFHAAQSGVAGDLVGLAQSEQGGEAVWGPWRTTPITLQERGVTFDLELTVAEHRGGLLASFRYPLDLFAPETLAHMARAFQTLLEGIAADPDRPVGDLPLLTPEEQRRLRLEWNAVGAAPPALRLHQLFEAQVERDPAATALVCDTASLAYGELNAQANRLAHELRGRGVGPESRVALCVERSPALVVGLLGILKAGAAYVPVDPSYPQERIEYLLADSGARLLLTQAALLERLPQDIETFCLDRDAEALARHSGEDAAYPVDPDHPAYLIYTSGSTGRPKGTVVTHRNAAYSTAARLEYYPVPVERFLLLSSFAFDSSVAGIFWTLSQGGCLVLPKEGAQKDPKALAETIAGHRISHLLCLPSLYGLLLDQSEPSQLACLRTVIVAGEACPRDLVARHGARHPETRLYNEYGPTEATVWSAVHAITHRDLATERPIPIGRPIANAAVYLLDARRNPVPVGVPGEAYIGGAGVARGYLDRPELSAERFVPDPGGVGRLYRSGDLARYRADGVLEFLGRVDQQVKIRGFRIEPGEIEAKLREASGVADAAVVVREDVPGDRRLVAYVVAQPAASLAVDELRRFLQGSLPDYMTPAAFVVLERLPSTPNGKLDRKALPAPDSASLSSQSYQAPEGAAEMLLADIWRELLRVERVGRHDNFFELGGDSILGIQAASRAMDAGFDMTSTHVFEYPSVAALAAAVVFHAPATGGDAAIPAAGKKTQAFATAAFEVADLPMEEIAVLSRDGDLEDIYPLTPMQEGMLFHTLLEPGSGIYVMQDRFDIEGDIDPDLFRRAWQSVVDRHPALRTSYLWEGRDRPLQRVHKRLDLPFEYLDWRGLTEPEARERLDALLDRELREGIDLARPPLIRVRLLRLGEERYCLAFTHHHIILDAWCNSLIFLEFRAAYEALAQGRPLDAPPVRPFRDYMGWLRSQDAGLAVEFWRDYLRGFTEPTPLVVDRAPGRPGGAVRDAFVQLSAVDTGALTELAQRHRLTPNTFIQAALAVLLSRYAGQPEVLFGVTVAGRPAELPDVEAMLGLFINGLPLRVSVRPEQPLLEFLRGLLQQNVLQRRYEFLPLTQIQGLSAVPRGQDLFQHLLTFENAPIDPSLREKTGAFHFVDVVVRTHTNYPITVMVIPGPETHLQITYQEERFEAATIERMLVHFRSLLEDMIRHPDKRVGELGLLGAAERRQLLLDWNRTDFAYPEPCDLVARFEAQTARTPEAWAVACQGGRLSYAELNARANRLAHQLTGLGIGPESLVALLHDRGLEFPVLMLAMFKAGAAYLPLDPAHPDARLAQVLVESRAGLVLVGTPYLERVAVLRGQLPGQPPTFLPVAELARSPGHDDNPVRRHGPGSLAFVIFTSGSTGTPKGAMVEHRGMFNNLITKVPKLGLTAADVIAQTAGQCFDISVWQHLTPLACGARVEIFPDEVVKEPGLLLAQVAERGVTLLEAVPSLIQALLELADGVELPRLRWLIACGEAFPPELCRRWMARFPAVRVLNAYGPAECSDDVSYYAVPEPPAATATVVPIGRAVDNTQLYLLDPQLNPVPVGVPGEICVAGIQVGRGYLHRPELTAAAFVPDPFGPPGGRLYRTGDLGRYRADGNIEFLGRIDHQLKLRGFRIEPDEIEAQLLRHPRVAQALVMAREDGRSGRRLVAYVVSPGTDPGADLALADELRAWLGERLPNYMVPAAFVRLDAMPLGGTGKVDRKALPAPDIAAQQEDRYVAPNTPAEETLVAIWQEVLGVERVGIHDNFFDLGGHSLLAVRVLSRVRAAFGVEVPLRALFEATDIEQLAVVVEEYLMGELAGLSEEEALALLAS
ncbi:amino acid adenylation domain-containing protein [Methylomagnum ishizawai]|uniref:Amino acid adenylation domain-containing protein n=1 Tax=Methylomagnum ishizawai TaxID=1760988 RepID=A0A1Y6DDJ3_9GAMM|nr:non-ribosomal peptide synthetase [Methylomagnum ishizawai]SMF97565.1 amino acid adenylation domain-containing protein [Methylomagnum ishizawai]